MRPIISLLVAVFWTIGIIFSLWTQRTLLDRTVESLARNDAAANLRKDMAIRKWAASVGGVYVDETKVTANGKLDDQQLFSERAILISLRDLH